MSIMEPSHKLHKIFLFFIFQILISFIVYSTMYNKRKAPAVKAIQTVVANSTVAPIKPDLVILLWTFPLQQKFTLNRCPKKFDISGCYYTADRSVYSSANAVVIHHRDACDSKDQHPPSPRPSRQYWIWFNHESPTHIVNLAIMNNLINLTMSYRADSDIFAPYGWLEYNNGIANFTIPKKTKLAAWAVTNWSGHYRRSKYYDVLKKYMHVDIFGQHLHLPRDKETHLKILSTYKFYFAFENSLYEDYITEKLWYNAFASGSVPVVMGPTRANYERFIPRDSFIHVDDFSSAQELASYLLSLDKDDKKYKQYFNWRSTYTVSEEEELWVVPYCRVCKALKEAPAYRTIPSIEAWFK